MPAFVGLRLLRLPIVVLLLTPVPVSGQQGLDVAVDAYVLRLERVMEEAASIDDLDTLLALYAAGATYEHPRMDLQISSRAAIRDGMSTLLGRTRGPSLRILDRILGKDVAVLELELQFAAQTADGWEPVRRTQVTVLEFENGLISKILDYW